MSSRSDVAVIGAGTMGAGIAEVAARSGARVYLCDVDENAIRRGMSVLRASVQRAVERGKITRSAAAELEESVVPTIELRDAADCEVVIEAVPERLELKRSVFAQVATIVSPDALLASNTSSLSIAEIGASVARPDRVVGMHFFNPAPAMRLVEVIKGQSTSDEALGRAWSLVKQFGKDPVAAKDTPGFIVNRVARPFYLEGLAFVENGYAGVSSVDEALKSTGFRMGPFELMDLVGIDVNFAVTRSLFERTFGEPRFRPRLLQEDLVRANHLGRKTGQGFYDYSTGHGVARLGKAGPSTLAMPPGPWAEWDPKGSGFIVGRTLSAIINEAYWAVGQAVATKPDVDLAMRLGANWPHGPFAWAEQCGLGLVIRTLHALRASFGDAYVAAPLLASEAT